MVMSEIETKPVIARLVRALALSLCWMWPTRASARGHAVRPIELATPAGGSGIQLWEFLVCPYSVFFLHPSQSGQDSAVEPMLPIAVFAAQRFGFFREVGFDSAVLLEPALGDIFGNVGHGQVGAGKPHEALVLLQHLFGRHAPDSTVPDDGIGSSTRLPAGRRS